jgi:hypothetical protein
MLNSQFLSDKNWELRIEHWSDLLPFEVENIPRMEYAAV